MRCCSRQKNHVSRLNQRAIQQWLDASGGRVFRKIIRPAMLVWIRAAVSSQPLDLLKPQSIDNLEEVL